MNDSDQNWVRIAGVSLKIGLVLALLYVGAVFLERHWAKWESSRTSGPDELHEDLYVHPKKTHISTFSTARSKLTGAPLWVKEGWRWACEGAGDRLLEPIELVTPERVFERDGQVWISFELDDGPCEIAVSAAGRFYVDEIFFIEDPRELFSHWTAEEWEKIEAHRVEPGMTEHQAAFALGVGILRESSSNGRFRTIEYSASKSPGVAPVSVRFVDGYAESIKPL